MAGADEAARYREAAQMTLGQLDWCVEYLRHMNKPKLAQQLAANTLHIRRRIDERRDDERLPGSQLGSTS